MSATRSIDLDYHQLLTGLGAGTRSTGTKVSAGQAHRLACNSSIIPTVLDGDSTILDAGRSRRLFPGCDRPPAWTEAHHNPPWSQDARTDLANGALRCCFHHHLIHRDHCTIRIHQHGHPELIDHNGHRHQHQRVQGQPA